MAGGLLGQGSLTTYNPTFREKVTDALRGLLFSDDREGQRKAERLSNVLEFTPYGAATAVDDVKEAVGQGDWATAGMMGAMAMVPGPSPKIKAYHGSPHSFDRFSMDKIGTGEGAQAYGHGLYFAENEGVAKSYRDGLTAKQPIQNALNSGQFDDPKVRAAAAVRLNGGEENALKVLYQNLEGGPHPRSEEAISAIKDGSYKEFMFPDGSMYEVSINASPDDFLDWDKPLSEQPKGAAVEKLLRDRMIEPKPGMMGVNAIGELGTHYNQIFARPPGGNADADVSKVLKRAGIPGIKYLDAGSRTALQNADLQRLADDLDRQIANASKQIETLPPNMQADYKAHIDDLTKQRRAIQKKVEPTRNYVVFDDKLIEIVRKYGIAGASAMLGYNILNMVDPAQARQMQEVDAQRPQMARSGW